LATLRTTGQKHAKFTTCLDSSNWSFYYCSKL